MHIPFCIVAVELPAIKPVPVHDRGDNGGQQAHEHQRDINPLSDNTGFTPDEGDYHRHLATGCHANPTMSEPFVLKPPIRAIERAKTALFTPAFSANDSILNAIFDQV
jgi:hypothetical protein